MALQRHWGWAVPLHIVEVDSREQTALTQLTPPTGSGSPRGPGFLGLPQEHTCQTRPGGCVLLCSAGAGEAAAESFRGPTVGEGG